MNVVRDAMFLLAGMVAVKGTPGRGHGSQDSASTVSEGRAAVVFNFLLLLFRLKSRRG